MNTSCEILIVEDSITQALLLKQLLNKNGFSVHTAENGIQAIEYINNNSDSLPELVISDIIMPEMNGLELCRLIKKIHPEIFVIMLTANTDDYSFKESFDSGAIDFINKPINETELFVRIKNILRIKNAEKELKTALLKLSESNRKLKELSITDTLTKIFNRRYLLQALKEQIIYNKRYKTPLSIVMIDIDYFKKINDTYGHDAGDEVLKSFSQNLKNNSRAPDIVGRYGGEEFLLILPNTSLNNGKTLISNLMALINETRYSFNTEVKITFSAGIAELKNESVDDLLIKADKLLYRAKENGRNRIESE